MDLTPAQCRVVAHDGGALRLTGGPGTGKTTALVARYLRLVDAGVPASSVLVVAPDRAAAARFRDRVLPHLSGGFDALPVTTWFGVAFDRVTRAQGTVRLLSSSEQRALVRRLLRAESPADWPGHGHHLGREAFAGEVAAALIGGTVGDPALDRFAVRYHAELAARCEADRSTLLRAAAEVAGSGRYAHLLVDDHDPGADALLATVGSTTDAVVVSEGPLPWPAPDVTLDQAFRRPAAGVLVTCRHPSTEAEAVAGELLAARSEGVPWSAMAVLAAHPSRHGRPVVRALNRHGIPVAPDPALGAGAGDPAVAAIVDVLRWAAGDDGAAARLAVSPLAALGADGMAALRDDVAGAAPTSAPADLAFAVWERGLGHLVATDDASLDAVVAFIRRLQRRAERDPAERLGDLLAGLDDGEVTPDPWVAPAGAPGAESVTVTTIAAAAGREWHTVVVAGCVEGALPRIRGRAPHFAPAPPAPAAVRQASLAEERRRFATACSRATAHLVATAAPEPGVLVSRFVEGWAPRPECPPPGRGPAPASRPATANPVGVFPDGRLALSASQLSTYDDCPLRYAYQYGLRVKDDAGPQMLLGTVVHEVLAEFLRPDRDGDHSREALLAIAADRWRDDIARYRPQVEECRRDYHDMLESWWAGEGERLDRGQVLKVEHGFDIEVGDLRIVGAIDRIDRAPDGAGIRIVDYKTGRSEPRLDALPTDIQLAVYHLAATLDPELAALGPPRQLQLLYVRTMHTFEQPILADHADTTTARVVAAAADIRLERFEPAVDAGCRTCSFHRLCPLQREGRQVGAR